MAAKTAKRKAPTAAQQEARKAERAAKAAALTEAAEAFELDEDDNSIMRAFASLTTKYSENNAVLILAQAAQLGLTVKDVNDVGGYGAFQERGRQVRKGERQIIFIWAPAGTSAKDEGTEVTETVKTAEGTVRVRKFFKPAGLFHVSQTDKIEQAES